ncbi:MAG: molecular chaperone HtpG [Proteobacteria bacterium]|nr:molecular chaperone HtpG [Pseudomonadota bacterium]
MSETGGRETLGFQTEVRQLLKLMIHSLYSNKEIFLRELISNASDAADKLRFEALAAPDLLADDKELSISIAFDKKARTLAISDNGIGMSRAELVDNLGTIARSGTADFLGKMSGDQKKDAQLIGQFGVGFYSAFIVADDVTVETRRADHDASASARWRSDGQGEFTVEVLERAERGTTVTLHLREDAAEFCEPLRIENLIRRYSDHIGFPVAVRDAGSDEEGRVINSATALWLRSRSEITDDEYTEFYKYLTHDFADPAAWSHNRVEGKREYTSLLFLPSAAPYDLWNRDVPRGLKLYAQRVFIMDDAEQFLPLYLRFVKGVVDSSDLPLNVSRELLQQNPELTTMRAALTRRVLDMLDKLARNETEKYAKFWTEFGQVLKEGLIEDTANKDKLVKLLRFATSKNDAKVQDQSLDDYVTRASAEQDKIYYILAENPATALASPHLERFSEQGVEVLLLTDRIDPWLADSLTEYEGKSFQDVGRADAEIPGATGRITAAADEKEHKALLKQIKRALRERVEDVQVSQRLVSSPACVVASASDPGPQLRRMLEASGQSLPASKPILEINVEHPLLVRLAGEADSTRFASRAEILLDHALLAEGSSLENPADYVQRMNNLLLELDSGAGKG